MQKLIFPILALLLCLACQNKDNTKNQASMTLEYPESTQDTTVTDDYHGTVIKDPYRWLEDDNAEDTKAWVTEQNKVTYGFLDQIPYRDQVKERLEKLWNYEKFGTPFKEGDKYYFFKNDGLQNQSVLYSMDNLDAEPKLVLDPNSLSEDGTASLGAISFDDSGKYMAYQVSEGGSDWRTVNVLNLESGELLEDKVEWVKFSGMSWKDDGFYYSRYPEPSSDDKLSGANEYHSVYYHKLGTSQTADKLVYVDNDHPQRNAFGQTTEDEDYLILSTSESTSGNELRIKNIKENGSLIQVVEGFDHDFNLIGNEGSQLYFMTNHDAPKNRIIRIDANKPDSDNWKEIVPESEDAMSSATVVGGRLFVTYMHDASDIVKVFDTTGKFAQDLKLPGIGNLGGISGKKKEQTAFYSFTSFTTPNTIYKLNTETLTSEVFKKPQLDFNTEDYETKQVWYKSKDGTEIPMFLTYKKGIELDGSNPTLLYGYGGFNIPILPSFSISRLPILENGGIYAVANIRGGGEFGKEWHKAGTKGEKQNVFDDFQAAAEYLIKEGYTSSEKLAIEGRSNGGLLVGACMTQRPDLYKVAFPGVGVLDMLRYHEFTIGWAWATDYGRSDDPEAFEYLIKYSPLHNVKEAAYPATMITTADHDDRVVPAHSFKFAAELQDKHNGENPVLIRVETSAGHGAGKPTSMRIEEAADLVSFMFYNMDEDISYRKN